MKRTKRALYWITYIPVGIVMIILGLLSGFFMWIEDKFDDLATWYEDWTFEYSKNGWIHLGNGIYRKEWKNAEADIHQK